MGNCSPKPKTRSEFPLKSKTRSPSPDPIRLHGCDSCPVAARIRIALLYKSVPVELVPLPNPLNRPFIQLGSETLNAPADSLLRHIDSRFAGGPPAAVEWGPGTMEALAAAVRLQHRSMERHVAGVERWARDLVAGKRGIGGKGRGIGDWYGRVAEMMLEHAQMEETFLFPLLDRAADSDACRNATEEHGRDLPMMNGIKEDIKMLTVMEAGTPSYVEALSSFANRFKKFQEHCKAHFQEEEKRLLPLLEAAERTRREDGGEPLTQIEWTERLMKLMQATHSQLFPILMAGLRPDEALQYIDLVCKCIPDDKKVVNMLRSLVSWHEGRLPLSWIRNPPFIKL